MRSKGRFRATLRLFFGQVGIVRPESSSKCLARWLGSFARVVLGGLREAADSAAQGGI